MTGGVICIENCWLSSLTSLAGDRSGVDYFQEYSAIVRRVGNISNAKSTFCVTSTVVIASAGLL